MIRVLLATLALLPVASWAADDPRISFLEQEVRNLQRQMQTVTWQLDQLRNRVEPAATASPLRAGASLPGEAPQWVDASRWKKLRRGMSELEVIGALGAPTSMRDDDGTRVLLYALEIGSSGFLGGSIRLRNRVVVELRQPVLQ